MYKFLLKFIQSTYEGPPYQKLGDGTELKVGTMKETPIGHAGMGTVITDSWVSLWLSCCLMYGAKIWSVRNAVYVDKKNSTDRN